MPESFLANSMMPLLSETLISARALFVSLDVFMILGY
jgi:hypothetical protein